MNATVIKDNFVPASQLCAGSYASDCTGGGHPAVTARMAGMPGLGSVDRNEVTSRPTPGPDAGAGVGRLGEHAETRAAVAKGVPNMTEGAPLLELRGVSKVVRGGPGP